MDRVHATDAPAMPTPIPATLIAGDGIGPEIVEATLAALRALDAPFEWDRQIAGLEGVKTAGESCGSVRQRASVSVCQLQ